MLVRNVGGATRTLCTFLVGVWNLVISLEDSLYIKLDIHLPSDPAFPPIGIYPREMKIHVYKKTGAKMFIIAFFIIAKNLKPPKYPST